MTSAMDEAQVSAGSRYLSSESGVLPESVFSDILDAIRGQNGLSTLYQPGDMAAAILALEWDVRYEIRALLLDDGTLEINYYERRTSVTGGRIVQVFEIDPAGYSSASARSNDSIKLLVKKVYIDSTISGLASPTATTGSTHSRTAPRCTASRTCLE